eukprot:4415594-Pyramimonas_sp.AAC.1
MQLSRELLQRAMQSQDRKAISPILQQCSPSRPCLRGLNGRCLQCPALAHQAENEAIFHPPVQTMTNES